MPKAANPKPLDSSASADDSELPDAAETATAENEAAPAAEETAQPVATLGAERPTGKKSAAPSVVKQFDASTNYLLQTHRSYEQAAYMTGQQESDIREAVRTGKPCNGFLWSAE